MNYLKQLTNTLKKENGSGLVLTMMVLLVLSVLGAALATVTIGSYRSTDNNRDSVSAYYIAEAGITESYEGIKTVVTDTYDTGVDQNTYFAKVEEAFDETNGKVFTNFDTQFGENPSAEIQIIKESSGNPSRYILSSVGKVGHTSRKIEKNFSVGYKELNTDDIQFPQLPDNAAAVLKNQISLSGGASIAGDTHLDSTADRSLSLKGEVTMNEGTTFIHPEAIGDKIVDKPKNFNSSNGPFLSNRAHSLPWENYYALVSNFPEFPEYAIHPNLTIYSSNKNNKHELIKDGTLYFNNWLVEDYFTNLELTSDIYFEEILVDSDYDLTIDTKGKDLSIRVDHLNLSNGGIHILGGGNITFYVKDKISIGAASRLNTSGKTNQVKIYYDGIKKVEMGGGQKIKGSLFAKNTPISLTAGSEFTGLVLSGGGDITLSGGNYTTSYIVAPNSNFYLTGGAEVHGTILGHSLSAEGESNLYFKEVPAGIVKGSEPSHDSSEDIDLITSDPAIETAEK